MKFFKPEDFDDGSGKILSLFEFARFKEVCIYMSNLANQKLAKEVKVIEMDDIGFCKNVIVTDPGIYEIRFKTTCKHNNVPLVIYGGHGGHLQCECGAKLIPTAFKEF